MVLDPQLLRQPGVQRFTGEGGGIQKSDQININPDAIHPLEKYMIIIILVIFLLASIDDSLKEEERGKIYKFIYFLNHSKKKKGFLKIRTQLQQVLLALIPLHFFFNLPLLIQIAFYYILFYA
ncbi:unnamed protein product [Choristocarpus tenellus]